MLLVLWGSVLPGWSPESWWPLVLPWTLPRSGWEPMAWPGISEAIEGEHRCLGTGDKSIMAKRDWVPNAVTRMWKCHWDEP